MNVQIRFQHSSQRLTVGPEHAIVHFDNRPEPLAVKLKRLMTALPQNSPVCRDWVTMEKGLRQDV
eukprot:494170-Pelagomonas_calceolata.AAC.1